MPIKLGKNAYKQSDTLRHWYDDPNDEAAIERLYGNLAEQVPYYEYPVLVHNQQGELILSDNTQSCELFKTQFESLMLKIKDLATVLDIKTEGLDIYDNKINLVDGFSENILCGFNGITTSKFALQLDPTFFADIKEYVETILNAMLRDVLHAKGTLERFIAAITVCEGGAWADIKIMATELNPCNSLFSTLERSRERLVNAIANDHINKYKEHFENEDNIEIQTHVNIFMQKLFSLRGKIKTPPINDVNIPKIELSDEEENKIVFKSTSEAMIAVRYMIFLDDIDFFELDFDNKYQPDKMLENVFDHINEQLVLIFHRYTKTIEEAARTTGKSPEEYLDSLNENAHDMIKDSIFDARSDCISDINKLLRSFDSTEGAYPLVLDEDLHHPNKPLSLKTKDQRLYWCGAIAAHSMKHNEVIDGFIEECIPLSGDIGYKLVSNDSKTLQWIETDDKTFVTPYDYISKTPGPHTYLIHNAASFAFLSSFQEAIVIYRIIMQEEEAFEDDLKLIQERYFMKPEFKSEDIQSPLAQAIQTDNVDEIKELLKKENNASILLARNIVTDLIGRAFWNIDSQYEIIELMLATVPDMRTALSKDQETLLIEWAIEENRSHLLCNLIYQSLNLNTVYTVSELAPMNMKIPMLHVAAWCGHEDLIDACLMRPDLNINQHGTINAFYPTALHIAAMDGNALIIKKILEQNNIDTHIEFTHVNMPTPLVVSITYNHPECIKQLIIFEPFEMMLRHRLLLSLRDQYGFEEICTWLDIKSKSLQWYQLLAKTRALTLENRLSIEGLLLQQRDIEMINQKMIALNAAVEGNDIHAIVTALKLPYPSAFTRFFAPASPETKKQTLIFEKLT